MKSPSGMGAVAIAVVLAFCARAAAVVMLPVLLLAPAAADGSCGPGGTGDQVAGVTLDAEQLANARTVAQVTAGRGLPKYAAVIALATVAQESTFRNILTQLDHDSIGLFQQRVRYYTAPVAGDPVRATNAFLDRLVRVAGWQTRPVTDVAADIQAPREDLRGEYAKWQALADDLTDRFWPAAAAPAGASPSGGPADLAAPPSCGAAGTGPGGGTEHLPDGLTLDGTPSENEAVKFALAQLGEPYVFGSSGPSSWDCSSLMQAAWASVGVPLPRTTFDQVNAGVPVPLASARSGDLVLIPGIDGTAQSPGHVGMVAGRINGVVWLVQAPKTGENVQMTSLSNWAGDIVAIRRVG